MNKELESAGRYLGIALANLVTTNDPGNLVIAFVNGDLRDELVEPIGRALAEFTMPGMLVGTSIDFVVIDERWRWRGTAALALERLYLS